MAAKRPISASGPPSFDPKDVAKELHKLISQSMSKGASEGMKSFMDSRILEKLAKQLKDAVLGLSGALNIEADKAAKNFKEAYLGQVNPIKTAFSDLSKNLAATPVDELVKAFADSQKELAGMANELSGFSSASYEIENAYSSIVSLMHRTVDNLAQAKDTAKEYEKMTKEQKEEYLKGIKQTSDKLKQQAELIKTTTAESKLRIKAEALAESKLKSQGTYYKSNLGSLRDLVKEYKTHRKLLGEGGQSGALLGSLRATAPKLQQTLGATRDFMSSIPVVGNQLNAAFGGAVSGAENLVEIFGKGGPWGIAIAAILAAFFGLDYLLAKFHKQLDDSVEGTGLFTEGWEKANKKINKLNIAGQAAKDMRTFQMSMEDVLKVTETLTRAGVNLDQLYTKDAMGIANITRVIALTKTLGIQDNKVFSLIENWGVDLHENMGSMIDTFSDLSTVVAKSNIGAEKFWTIVGNAANQMTVFNKNVDSAGRLLSALGSAGVLTTSQLNETLSSLTTSFGKASYSQRVMFADVFGGGKGIKEVFGLRKDILKKNIQDALGEGAVKLDFSGDISVRKQMGEEAFAKLPLEIRTMVTTLDHLSDGIKAQSVAGYQDFVSLPETLKGLQDIASQQNMTLDQMLKSPQNQELIKQQLEATGMSVDTLKGIEYSLENIMEVDDNGTTKQLKNWDDLIKWTLGDGTGEGQKKRLDEIKKKIVGAAEERAAKETNFINQALTYFGSFQKYLQSIDNTLWEIKHPFTAKPGSTSDSTPNISNFSANRFKPLSETIDKLKAENEALKGKNTKEASAQYESNYKKIQEIQDAQKEITKNVMSGNLTRANSLFTSLVTRGLVPATSTGTPTAPTQADISDLAKAVMGAESGTQGMGATSPTGVKGTMQITGDTAKYLADKYPELGGIEKIQTDETTNKKAGELYLQELKKQFGSNELAVAAYNAGPQTISDYLQGKGFHAHLEKYGISDYDKAKETVGEVNEVLAKLGEQPTQITQNILNNITPGDMYTVQSAQGQTAREFASNDYSKQGGFGGNTIYSGNE